MHEIKQACLLAFTETWLGDHVRDNDLLVDGFFKPIRLDRNKKCHRERPRRRTMLLRQPEMVQHSHCSRHALHAGQRTPVGVTPAILLGYPFYLPRDFPQLFFTLVYSHPHANAARAAELISHHINKLDSISPDAPKFVLGDSNHCRVGKH